MAEHFHEGLVPTELGLRVIAERLGCTFERDGVERCYRVLPGTASCVQTVEMWGDDSTAARVHIGNWMLRQSEVIHG